MRIDLGSATMCNWAVKMTKRIKTLMKVLQQKIRSRPVTNINERQVLGLNKAGRSNTSKSYPWCTEAAIRKIGY